MLDADYTRINEIKSLLSKDSLGGILARKVVMPYAGP